MRNSLILLLASTILLSACQAETPSIEISTPEGTWLRPINGAPGEFEGIRFDADGSFGLINIYSMSGLNWQQTGTQLTLNTLTERYPEAEASTAVIEKVAETELVLSGDSFFASTYQRDNNAGGVITGNLNLPADITLPDGAILTISLEDVSLADAPSKLVGNRIIPVAGQSTPINWRVYYPTAIIDTRNRYNISAVISFANKLQYRTTSAYGVISDGMSSNINIEVVASNPPTVTQGKPMQGMYSYMADAGIFLNCADQKSYPVTTEAANAGLERAYSELKPGTNEKVWVALIGQLVERADMEGDGSGLNLLVEKVISASKEKTCPVGSIPFAGKQWQLSEITDSNLAADADLSAANLEFTAAGSVSGSGGCNRLNASYTVDSSNLSIGPMMMTRKACQGELGMLETAFTQALDKVDGFVLADGVLQLLQEGEPLLKFITNKTASLGGKWRLSKLAGLSIPDDINPGDVAYLEFSDNGKLSGKTGCNNMSSSYTQNESSLKFGIAAGTMMACPPDLSQIEITMHKMLAQTQSFEISNNTLILKDQQQAPLAWFKQEGSD